MSQDEFVDDNYEEYDLFGNDDQSTSVENAQPGYEEEFEYADVEYLDNQEEVVTPSAHNDSVELETKEDTEPDCDEDNPVNLGHSVSVDGVDGGDDAKPNCDEEDPLNVGHSVSVDGAHAGHDAPTASKVEDPFKMEIFSSSLNDTNSSDCMIVSMYLVQTENISD